MSPQTLGIDEIIEVTVTANESMVKLQISNDLSFENGSSTFFGEETMSTMRNLSFNVLGLNTIYFKVKNRDDLESVKALSINATAHNALKVNTIEVISFFEINEI